MYVHIIQYFRVCPFCAAVYTFSFSPSVLDRLNALLEPGGVLTVDERGAIDGEIPVIKPHPSFRY